MDLFRKKQGLALASIALLLMSTLLTGYGKSAEPPAKSNGISSSAEVAMHEGPDRETKLVEAAKKEGSLTLYTSMALEDMQKLTEAFEKKYGIKVTIWRAGSEAVLNRAVTEARGGKFDFDIVESNGPEMEALHREKLLQEVKSPYMLPVTLNWISRHSTCKLNWTQKRGTLSGQKNKDRQGFCVYMWKISLKMKERVNKMPSQFP